MPKVKTNKAAAKRFRMTGTGRIRRQKAYKSHILTKKSPSRKRRLRTASLIDGRDQRNVRRLIPYK